MSLDGLIPMAVSAFAVSFLGERVTQIEKNVENVAADARDPSQF